MGKILILPDVHGRKFWKDAIEAAESKAGDLFWEIGRLRKIFKCLMLLGDYFTILDYLYIVKSQTYGTFKL